MRTLVLSIFMLLGLGLSAQMTPARDITVLAQPNPVHEKLQLIVQSNQPVTFTATIRDLTGMSVIDVDKTTVTREGSKQVLDFGNLDGGIYICRIVFSNGEVRTIRLLKD